MQILHLRFFKPAMSSEFIFFSGSEEPFCPCVRLIKKGHIQRRRHSLYFIIRSPNKLPRLNSNISNSIDFGNTFFT